MPYDPNSLADVLANYGEGYRNPALTSDSEIYDTSNVLARMQQGSGMTHGMRGLAELLSQGAVVPEGARSHLLPFILKAGAGGLNTAANWLDWRPRIGPDTLAPLGLAAFGAAPVGAFAANALRRAPQITAEDLARMRAEMRANPEFADHIRASYGYDLGPAKDVPISAAATRASEQQANIAGSGSVNVPETAVVRSNQEQRRSLSATEVEQLRARRAQGVPYSQLSEEFGLSRDGLRHIVESGYSDRTFTKRQQPELQKLLDLARSGNSYSEIAKAMGAGYTKNTVAGLLNRLRKSGGVLNLDPLSASVPGTLVNALAED